MAASGSVARVPSVTPAEGAISIVVIEMDGRAFASFATATSIKPSPSKSPQAGPVKFPYILHDRALRDAGEDDLGSRPLRPDDQGDKGSWSDDSADHTPTATDVTGVSRWPGLPASSGPDLPALAAGLPADPRRSGSGDPDPWPGTGRGLT